MMGVVHAALRRDLERVRLAICVDRAAPRPATPAGALGEHVVWLMDFLHAHHEGEDRGLWPLVRDRNPAAAAAVGLAGVGPCASRPAGHRTEHGRASVRRVQRRRGRRVALVESIDALAVVLFPHLDREVDEAMPVVSAAITRAEWDEIEQTYYVKPKSLGQLGMEAHWVLDGIDDEGYQVVVHTVPWFVRLLILSRFRRQVSTGPPASAGSRPRRARLTEAT